MARSTNQDNKQWYAVRCVFLHEHDHLYEERILLVSANSFEFAIEKAEAEAAEYVDALGEGTRYVDYADTYMLDDEPLGDKTEVFSLMRKSPLTPKAYIDRFFDTGDELRQTVEHKQ